MKILAAIGTGLAGLAMLATTIAPAALACWALSVHGVPAGCGGVALMVLSFVMVFAWVLCVGSVSVVFFCVLIAETMDRL